MSRFRSKYIGLARDNQFHQFDNAFFANPAPLRRIAMRDAKKRDLERNKARRQKESAADY